MKNCLAVNSMLGSLFKTILCWIYNKIYKDLTSSWLHHHDPIWYFAIFFLTLLEAKGKVEEEAKESEEKETYLTLKISAELQSIGIELYNEDKDPVRGWRYQSTAFSKLNVTIGHVSVYSIFKYIYQWRI